jgi:hypothetical protein
MSTTHHGPRLTRTQRLQRVAVFLWLAAIIFFTIAASTGSNFAGGTALLFVALGVWASHKADRT